MIYCAALALIVGMRFLLTEDTVRNRRIFCTFSTVVLTLVAVLRASSVGVDTELFIGVFSDIAGKGIDAAVSMESWTELGFRLLCAAIGFFTEDPQWLIVVTGTFINVSVGRFIYRHSQNVYLSFYLYMTLMLFPLYLSMMRQAIAISIWMFAYDFFKKKKLVPYLLLVLLASTFHTSALLFLVFPLLWFIHVDRVCAAILCGATAAVSCLSVLFASRIVSLIQVILPRYAGYESTTFDALYFYLAVFATITVYGIGRLYFTAENERFPHTADDAFLDFRRGMPYDERSALTLLMLIGCVFAALMTRYGIVERIFNYFEVLYLLWVPMFLPVSPTVVTGRRRVIAFRAETLAVCAACFVYFAVILFARSELWFHALPYRFFWQ